MGSYAADTAPGQEGRAQALREALLAEYLRIQGKDWYEVLDLSRTAEAGAVEQRFRERMQSFSLEEYAQHDIGRDYAKLEEVHSAYRSAGEVLGEPGRRVAYDRELGTKRERPSVPMESELLFREGERRLSANLVPGAIEKFTRAVALAPDVADYQAALGWALHLANPGGPKTEHHLTQALAIDPDHAAAHEYLGRVRAEAQKDAIAAEHLERALDPEPPRLDALPVLEEVRARFRRPENVILGASVDGRLVGTVSCAVRHVGICIGGHLHVQLDDGREMEIDRDETIKVLLAPSRYAA